MIETPRLLLRNFVEPDLDEMAELMANPDFMRFSTGVFSREKTTSFLFDRVIAPARAGQPSLFAVDIAGGRKAHRLLRILATDRR